MKFLQKLFVFLFLLFFSFSTSFSQFGLNKLKNALAGDKITDQGITSKVHEKNKGKIVWSDSRIQFSGQESANLISEFTSADNIYGRGYLEKCLFNFSVDGKDKDCYNTMNEYELRIGIDGATPSLLMSNHFPNQEWTTFQISFVLSSNDKEDGINQGMTTKWANIVNKLTKGTHSIVVELWGGKKGCEQKKYAEGSFKYTKESDAKIEGSGEKVPKPSMVNQKLEKEMIQQIIALGWKNETPIDIVILESDWRINRDFLGNIIDREINTFAIIKNNSTGECHATDMSFKQPYNGKKYGNTQFYGLGMKKIPVECSDFGK